VTENEARAASAAAVAVLIADDMLIFTPHAFFGVRLITDCVPFALAGIIGFELQLTRFPHSLHSPINHHAPLC
jgi:hypothetical protein